MQIVNDADAAALHLTGETTSDDPSAHVVVTTPLDWNSTEQHWKIHNAQDDDGGVEILSASDPSLALEITPDGDLVAAPRDDTSMQQHS
jgi:hypothetical protein